MQTKKQNGMKWFYPTKYKVKLSELVVGARVAYHEGDAINIGLVKEVDERHVYIEHETGGGVSIPKHPIQLIDVYDEFFLLPMQIQLVPITRNILYKD